MRLRNMATLAMAAYWIAFLLVWALDRPGNRVILPTPPIVHYQLVLRVDGPSPSISVEVYSHNIVTSARRVLVRGVAPVEGLFVPLGCIIAAMVASSITVTRKARRNAP